MTNEETVYTVDLIYDLLALRTRYSLKNDKENEQKTQEIIDSEFKKLKLL